MKMDSTIIGKRLTYEGDKAVEEKNYTKAIKKYLKSEKVGYFGEGESRLWMIANSLNNFEIEEENIPNTKTLIKLGERLLWSNGDSYNENSIIWDGYSILLQMVPEKKILRETKMYMDYLYYLNV